MPRAPTVCLEPGCPHPATDRGRCATHNRERKRQWDARRPSASERGYTSAGHRQFRRQVLERDPYCTCPGCPSCTAVGTRCLRDSTQADHFPHSRSELVLAHKDPNDPRAGRGMCGPCHSHSTTQHQPGGWNATPQPPDNPEGGGEGPPTTYMRTVFWRALGVCTGLKC
jgi:5-methylcytosine-specific restriction protein A